MARFKLLYRLWIIPDIWLLHMYSRAHIFIKFSKYYLKASNGKGHGIHSPFVYDLVRSVLNDRGNYSEYASIEDLRLLLINDQDQVSVQDFGAGSGLTSSNTRTISSIARHAAKPKKYGQLLFRMVRHYGPKTILELGSSLGLTTAYLASASRQSRVITMEGAAVIAKKAEENFKRLNLENISIVKGNFDDTLHATVANLPAIDLAFIDGNHREEPTVRYFESILSNTNDLSIIILDDIHWSKGMEAAWEYCKSHPRVTLSIDLFFIGILVFRESIKEKQDFMVRF